MTVEMEASPKLEPSPTSAQSVGSTGLSVSSYNRESSALFQHYSSSRGKKDKVVMEWKNLNYETMVKDPASPWFMPKYTHKKILQNCSGVASSGEMLAIMGPTGCGKTSFLNIMAARVSAAGSKRMELTGSITVNGEARKDDVFRKLSAYVQQDDKLYGASHCLPAIHIYRLPLCFHAQLPTFTCFSSHCPPLYFAAVCHPPLLRACPILATCPLSALCCPLATCCSLLLSVLALVPAPSLSMSSTQRT
jgi:hypothetical protein